MKKLVTYLTVAFLGMLQTQAQDLSYEWHQMDPQNRGYFEGSVIRDSIVYNVLSVTDTLDADFGPGTNYVNPTAQGYFPNSYPAMVVLTKTNTDGTHIEAKALMQSWQNSSSISVNAMEITNDDKIVIVGFGRDTTFNFNPGGNFVGSYTSTGGTGVSSRFSFVAFYDLSGNYLSHFEYNAAISNLYFQDAAIDGNNNLYICGSFRGTVDFDFTAGTDDLSSTLNSSSGMLMKINLSSNNYEWTKAFHPTEENSTGAYMNYLEAKNNKIYINGTFDESDSLDVDPSSSQVYETINGLFPLQEVLIVLDQNGDYLNSVSFGGTNDEIEPGGMTVDDIGNVFLTGIIYGNDTVDFDPSTAEQLIFDLNVLDQYVYLVKYDNSLNYHWHKKIFSLDEVGFDYLYSFSYVQSGNVEIAINVQYKEGLFVDSSGDIDTLVDSNNRGCSILTFEKSTGDFLDSYSVEINGPTGYTNARIFDQDESGNFYTFGLLYGGPVDFNSENGVVEGDSSEVNNSPFMLKVHYCNALESYVVASACDSYDSPSGLNTWTSTGVYTESFTGANNCDSSYVTSLTIYGYPNPDVILDGMSLIAQDTSPIYYQWINCADSSYVFNETGQVFTPTSNGDYALIVSNGSCFDTSACFSMQNVGIKNVNQIAGLRIYPNPSKDIFTIEIESADKFSLEIFDVRSTLVYSKNFIENKEIIDLSPFDSGVYILKLLDDKSQIFTGKIMKL